MVLYNTRLNKETKNGTSTCREQVNDLTRIQDSMDQKSSVRNVFAKQKTHKEDDGHQTPNEEVSTFKKDDKMHFAPNGGNVKTRKREKVTKPTPK